MMVNEFFKLKGFEESYEISKDGIVKSIDRVVDSKCKLNGRTKNTFKSIVRKPQLNLRGYYSFQLRRNGKYVGKELHRLLAETFIPNENNLSCVNHIDGCKTNNSLDNLEWCSYSDNIIHAYKNGLRSSGEKRNGSKFPMKTIPYIIKLAELGLSAKEISNIINVNKTTIYDLINGKTLKPECYALKDLKFIKRNKNISVEIPKEILDEISAILKEFNETIPC